MIELSLSIVLSTGVYLIFRQLAQRGIAPLPVVVLNYPICVLAGLAVLMVRDTIGKWPSTPAFWLSAAFLGSMFMLMFWVAGVHTRFFGAGSSALISRLSLVLPVAYSAMRYHEPFGWRNALGLLGALLAIYFTIDQQSVHLSAKGIYRRTFLLPLVLFSGFGLNDIVVKTVSREHYNPLSELHFVTAVFAFAFLAGVLVLLNPGVPNPFNDRRIYGLGLALGLANFGGFFFFLRALENDVLPGTELFPLNSVAIVALTVLAGHWLYAEKLNHRKKAGLLLATVSIILLRL